MARGAGNGTFASEQTHGTGVASALAAADFNADGVVDLAAATVDATGGIAVLLGGAFGATARYGAGPWRDLAAADFSADGITDVAAAGGGVMLFMGNGSAGRGDGTFQPSDSVSTGISDTRSLKTADLNADGI